MGNGLFGSSFVGGTPCSGWIRRISAPVVRPAFQAAV